MICVRLFEFFFVVFGEFSLLFDGFFGKFLKKKRCVLEFSWFFDLMDWGKFFFEVIIRYWKLFVIFLFILLKSLCNEKLVVIIRDIEKKISFSKLLICVCIY